MIDATIDLIREYARRFRRWSAIGFWAVVILAILRRNLSLTVLLFMSAVVVGAALVNMLVDRLVGRESEGREEDGLAFE